jgi:hypothetical protein
MAYLAVLVIGIAIGWVIFEKPQWSKDMLGWFKDKISGWWK